MWVRFPPLVPHATNMNEEVINFWYELAKAQSVAQQVYEQFSLQLGRIKWAIQMAEYEEKLGYYM